jgi:branched-chain amino acid transport system permease protein
MGWLAGAFVASVGLGELVHAMSSMFPGFFGDEGRISGNRVTGETLFGITFGPQIQLYDPIAGYTFVCTAMPVGLGRFAFTRRKFARRWSCTQEEIRDEIERREAAAT